MLTASCENMIDDHDEENHHGETSAYFRSMSTGHDLNKPIKPNLRRAGTRRFSILMSTADHFQDKADGKFYGPYAHIRKQLDYTYHSHYQKERQWMQDSIIEEFLENVQSTDVCTTPTEPWLIYTVGAPGAGKIHTLMTLVRDRKLPLLSFVLIDPDAIRRRLPEFQSFVQKCPDKVDALTSREAGYIVEILTLAAVQSGKNVVLDGCLQSTEWHGEFFDSLKIDNNKLKIGMLHITAPRDTILQRALEVAIYSGRIIPVNVIDQILEQIPKSIVDIEDTIDYFCDFSNDGDEIKITTKGQSWESLYQTFLQTCAWFPGQKKGQLGQLATEAGRKEALDAALKAAPSIIDKGLQNNKQKRFSVLISSEENHKTNNTEFYGAFSHIRSTLDYTYHAHYTRERQSLQDAIIKDMLNSAVIKDVNGDVCTTPTEPWIVFTAGAMGAGKSYTMNKLVEEGRFPLLAFVLVDPDEIRRHLPEFHLYVDQSPELAGELTRKEAGFISEILTLAGLQAGKNVMVDGSLRDSDWYQTYFERLREEFPALKLAIIHVMAPREAVFQRAAERALTTGRVVPRETLEMALDQVPRSVKILGPLVTYFCELNNAPGAPDIELMTDTETWESFERNWHQTCAWVPSRRKFLKPSKGNDPKLALGGKKVY